MKLILTTWNLEWFGQLLKGYDRTISTEAQRVTSAAGKRLQALQKERIAEEIRLIGSDILCIQEGPSTGQAKLLQTFCEEELAGEYVPILRPEGEPYHIRGAQAIWFLVKRRRLELLQPTLLPIAKWWEATERQSRFDPTQPGEHGRKWPINHPYYKPQAREPEPEDGEGEPLPPDLGDREHFHYRHPQTLVCQIGGKRIDFIGLHLKSKFSGEDYAPAGRIRRELLLEGRDPTKAEAKVIAAAEQKAVEARIKISTEAEDVRYYIDSRFEDEPFPALFLLGDLNDGVGKEYFERRYLFHDLLSNLQGDVFFARRFLNHALFDYGIDGETDYRWTVRFEDAWEPYRDPKILLDHIMFTQAVVGADAFDHSPLRVPAKAGRVEHAAHNATNMVFERSEDHTSDHRPVSVDLELADGII
ncbi:hypothetical protein [Jiella marina]|uniref:hypothetical protein n=1 Tax=Jiella sp. LLJ827 TaxID=2917712 RepID=UPI002100BAF2|nr:hypothetical protein [Jiella sp. LLJ827]MCQ0987914.1 hypothetical protein [Jiella sp. LLJ827]